MTQVNPLMNPALCQEQVWDHYGRKIQCQTIKLSDSDYCPKHHAIFLELQQFRHPHTKTPAKAETQNEWAKSWEKIITDQQKRVFAEGERHCHSCNCALDEDSDAIFYCDRCGTDHDICEDCIGQVRGYSEKLCASCETELGLLEQSCTRCHAFNDADPEFFVTCTRCQLVICKDCIDPEDDCDFPNPAWLCHTCRAGIPLLGEDDSKVETC